MESFDANWTDEGTWALSVLNGSQMCVIKECYEDALAALDQKVKANEPVIVGGNYTNTITTYNFDQITDHWVIINGRGEDEKGVYYTYIEVAETQGNGTSTELNRFYQNDFGLLESLNKTTNSNKYKIIITCMRFKPNNNCCSRANFEKDKPDESCIYYTHKDKYKGQLMKIR